MLYARSFCTLWKTMWCGSRISGCPNEGTVLSLAGRRTFETATPAKRSTKLDVPKRRLVCKTSVRKRTLPCPLLISLVLLAVPHQATPLLLAIACPFPTWSRRLFRLVSLPRYSALAPPTLRGTSICGAKPYLRMRKPYPPPSFSALQNVLRRKVRNIPRRPFTSHTTTECLTSQNLPSQSSDKRGELPLTGQVEVSSANISAQLPA